MEAGLKQELGILTGSSDGPVLSGRQSGLSPIDAEGREARAPALPVGDALTALRAFSDHMTQGEIHAALKAASDACHANKELPEAHYAYGEAWLALGEPSRAEQAFATAIQLRPAWADAWINYGLARYRQGAIADATEAMRRALIVAPDHAVARANLGAFLRISGSSETAEVLLRDTLDGDPANAGARLNLVADLLQEERPADALALLEAATPPADDAFAARHWHLQAALALLQLGRPADARVALEAFSALGPVPMELEPLLAWRHVLLGLAERDVAGARAAAESMEASLGTMGPKAVLEHRIMGRYDLAKYWSGEGQHARAFAQWQAGHELLQTLQPFSREAHAAVIEANIKAFTPLHFKQGPRAQNRDAAPIFIVGMPRSGTTLIEQILAAHPQGHGAGERTALGNFASWLGGGDDAAAVLRLAELDAGQLDAAAERYLAELHALAPDKTRIVDKMPGNYLHVGLAALMFPEAKFIHCQRDPRDIGLSIFTFRFHGSHGYAHDLADLGWTIAQQERLMAHFKAALPGRVLSVKLSDWVEDFDATLARVLAHVDLPHDEACTRFHERESRVRTVSRAQVRQPINARGLGRWRIYEAELQPLIAELDRAGALNEWCVDRFAFAPERARTKAMDRVVRRRFVESVDAVLSAARARGIAIEGDQAHWAKAIVASDRVPPSLWACYHDLVQAALRDDADSVARLGSELLNASTTTATPVGHVVTLTPDDLAANVERYARMIDNDPENPLALQAVSPAEVARVGAMMAEARDLLAEADPVLLDEIDTLGHEIMLATGRGPRGFGGAASVFLWGAVLLNPTTIADRVTLIESLAHETAHALLFGLTLGDDLTTNGPAERYASPLRPDPRPIEGIVHATYVLARMNHALARLQGSTRLTPQERASIDAKRARNRASYESGLAIVDAHARLTGDGLRILEACRRAMAEGGAHGITNSTVKISANLDGGL